MAQQQSSGLQSLSYIQNHAARLNDEQQLQPAFISSHRIFQVVRTTRKNVLKGVFLIVVVSMTFWMASSFLNQTLIRQRTPFRFGTSPSDVEQIAAPDQIAYKSFYYYQKMVQVAKQNVKKRNSYQIGDKEGQQFSKMDFQQLYGIFKVVKAIQLANGYEITQEDPQIQDQNQINYDQIQNLTTAINLTQFFNKAADQARCSSCYSFPIAATIQYQIYRKTGNKVKLSEQQLIDCSNPNKQENGCNDGNITRGFQWVVENGLVEQKMYPYRSQSGRSYPCDQKVLGDSTVKRYKIKAFRQLSSADCRAIKYQLIQGNAVSAMINTGRMDNIKNYSEPFRDCPNYRPNHAVTIVGQTQNQDWIVRNSWGQSWGNNGYFVIKRGNTCGICNHATVPQYVVQQNP